MQRESVLILFQILATKVLLKTKFRGIAVKIWMSRED